MFKKIFLIIIVSSVLITTTIILNEVKNTVSISNAVSIRTSIAKDLEKIYNEKVTVKSIDDNVEEKSRIVYFNLSENNTEKIALYLTSFLPNRIKYIDEVQNIDKYKDYFK